MNIHRVMAMAVTACSAGLSVTACTAGVTSAGPATSRSPATGRAASSPSAAASAGTVSVGAPIGSFPVPPGSHVLASTTCDHEIIIELGSVTPQQASGFYLSALPRADYKVTGHTLVDGTGNGLAGAGAEIEFTGHGYKGQIVAVANLGALSSTGPSPVSVPSNIAKNFLTVTLTPSGAPGCASPPGL